MEERMSIESQTNLWFSSTKAHTLQTHLHTPNRQAAIGTVKELGLLKASKQRLLQYRIREQTRSA